MKRASFIAGLCLLLGLGLSSCHRPSLAGTWIEPAEENSIFGECGFTLNADGTVTPINTGYRQYSAWKQVGDQLILTGQYTGSVPKALADTMWIDELTDEKLVLKDFGNYSVTYQRKTENEKRKAEN